jgi:putative transposase
MRVCCQIYYLLILSQIPSGINGIRENIPRSQTPVWERPSVNSLVPKLQFRNKYRRPEGLALGYYYDHNRNIMRTRYRIFEEEYLYFLTCTIVGWLPVFTRNETVDIVLECWRYLQSNRDFKLFGYVILENHLHLIASAPQLSTVIKSFKAYTAQRILRLLENKAAHILLKQLRAHKLRHKARSQYQLWQEGSHPKQISNDETMWQKLEYIHNNPLNRGYVDDPLHWRYSSARNYAGLPGLIEVITDWR